MYRGINMKIAFLHISDLHLKDNNGVNIFQLEKLTDTLNNSRSMKHLFIIITGDSTFSGGAHQFEHVYHTIGRIISLLREKHRFSENISVCCVPGNHDVDHSAGIMNSQTLQELRKTNSYGKCLEQEAEKQTNFYNFASKNNCFTDDKYLSQCIVDIDGFNIEVNMINSAIFSIFDEDKGLHYIPDYCINKLNSPTSANFVISIIHHAPDWYTDLQKNKLEMVLYSKSSLVFLGHEHHSGTKSMHIDDNAGVFIQAGGCLCNNDDWSQSEYHVGVFDTFNYSYDLKSYSWEATGNLYVAKNKKIYTLTDKPSTERSLMATTSFLKNLKSDSKRPLNDDYQKYYVFPRIQREKRDDAPGKEFIDEKAFIDELIEKKRVIITGTYNSGKTTLLKNIFLMFPTDIQPYFAI